MRGLSSLYKGLSGVAPTADDIEAVKKAGDTMTGALILSGSPTEPNQAATKSYVDSNIYPASTTNQGVSYLNNPITIANNATDANNDIDFSAGTFQFSDGSGQALATAMTKRLDATWSAGTGNGGLFNGAAVPKAISSTYHCYKIYNPTTGAEDSGYLLGVAGAVPDPTSVLPSGYTKFKRVGSILTDSSGNIRPFLQIKDYFSLTSPILSISYVSQLNNTETLRTISTPSGIITEVDLSFFATATTAGNAKLKVYDANKTISSLASNDGNSFVSYNVIDVYTPQSAKTNISSQVKTNMQNNFGTPIVYISITVDGWKDITL